MMASSPPLLLAEEEVLEAFDCFVRASIGNAKARHLLANSWDGGEPGVSVTGPALCLYHAAMKSGTNPPSVAMPHYEGSGALQKRLNSSTCPAGFHHLFERWARMVPDILDLPRNNQYDLEKLLCDPPLGTPVQYHVASMDYPVTTLVHNIADALRSLAHDISYCRSYQQRQNPHIQPNMNTNPIAPPWPVPSMWSRDANLIEPATPHHENYVTQIGPHHYHNLQEQQYATHPNYMSPPPVGLAPSVLSPSPRPVTPVSYQGPFFPTGITSGPAPHIDSPRPTSVPVAFPAAQPFGTFETTPATNLSRYNTLGPNYRLRSTHDVTASTERRTIAPIGAHTPMSEIINQLCSYDCQDLSKHLNHSTCSKYPISRGGFGEVYQGELFDGTEVAIKTMIINNHITDDVQKHLKHAARELLVWSKCRHSNVAQLLGLAMFREQIAMVSLWLENGNLCTYVKRYPDVDRINLCTQVAAGLAHLHSIGIIHGDLKGANVLVSREGVATLIDFGSAACEEFSLHFTKTKTSNDMSVRWAAPEILEGGTVSAEADVYALGMTALEALTGSAPYNGLGDTATITAVLVKKEFPVRPNNHILGMTEQGNALWWLFVSCWVWTPSDRPTAEQVCISFEKIKELSQEYVSNASWYTQ